MVLETIIYATITQQFCHSHIYSKKTKNKNLNLEASFLEIFFTLKIINSNKEFAYFVVASKEFAEFEQKYSSFNDKQRF